MEGKIYQLQSSGPRGQIEGQELTSSQFLQRCLGQKLANDRNGPKYAARADGRVWLQIPQNLHGHDDGVHRSWICLCEKWHGKEAKILDDSLIKGAVLMRNDLCGDM